MSWGKRPNDHAIAPAGAISGHIDGWEDVAVDYLDGRLDPQTKTLVEQHLAGCPACAARLRRQQSVITYLQQTPLDDTPFELEDRVLGEVLFPREPAPRVRKQAVEQPKDWSTTWHRRIKPWIPATVAVAAVLAGLVGFGVLRSGVGLPDEREATTVAAAGAAANSTDADSPMMQAESSGEDALTATTLAAAFPGATATTAATGTTRAAGDETVPPDLKAFGPSIQDRQGMISGLSELIGSPAYFLFEGVPAATTGDEGAEAPTTTVPSPITGNGDTLVSPEQAEAVAAQITALTGLEPLDEALSLSRPTFAAYIPRDDRAQFIDLLRSIATSLGLTVGLNLEPGPAVTGWVPLLFEHKTELVELSAKRTPSPAVSSWTFTTSTLVPPSENTEEVPAVMTPDDAGTHVLVVILVNVLP